MQPKKPTRSQALLAIAMDYPDQFVAAVKYLDERGNVTDRIISPVRYLTANRVCVYCLGREAPRTFRIAGILKVTLKHTCDVLAPEAIKILVDQRNAIARKSPETSGK